jgi:hypothetical protein
LRVRLAFIQLVDGAPVGQGDSLSLDLSASVCVGSDAGAPVMTDYKPPFAFTGTVKEALVDLTGEAVEDMAAKTKMYLVRQEHLERGRVPARSVYTSRHRTEEGPVGATSSGQLLHTMSHTLW